MINLNHSEGIDPNLANAIRNDTLDESQIADLIINGNVSFEGGKFENNGVIYKPIHFHPTIPFEGAIKPNDIKGKSVCTNRSSGDALIWILASYPESVTTFGDNAFDTPFTSLKIAAIRSLEYDDYLDFFYRGEFLDNYLVDCLSKYISKERLEFWLKLRAKRSRKKLVTSPLFVEEGINPTKNIPFLKDEKTYLKVQKAINDSEITPRNYNLSYVNLDTLKKTFDTVFINDWSTLTTLPISHLSWDVRYKISPMLNPGGTCIATDNRKIVGENVLKIGEIYSVRIKK